MTWIIAGIGTEKELYDSFLIETRLLAYASKENSLRLV